MHVPRKKTYLNRKKKITPKMTKTGDERAITTTHSTSEKNCTPRRVAMSWSMALRKTILYIDSTTSKGKKLTVTVNNIIEIDSTIIKGKKLTVTKRRKRVPEKNFLEKIEQ